MSTGDFGVQKVPTERRLKVKKHDLQIANTSVYHWIRPMLVVWASSLSLPTNQLPTYLQQSLGENRARERILCRPTNVNCKPVSPLATRPKSATLLTLSPLLAVGSIKEENAFSRPQSCNLGGPFYLSLSSN